MNSWHAQVAQAAPGPERLEHPEHDAPDAQVHQGPDRPEHPPWQVCPFRSWRVCSCQGLDCNTTLPTLILDFADLEEQQYYPKSTLAWRILVSSQGAFTKHRTSLYSDFLHAHTAPLSTKSKRFSTDEYATLVQGFVQGFADLHLHLHLSETAFQEPGL